MGSRASLREAVHATGSQTGEIIAGRYVLEAELARGGMGRVYRARELSSGSRLALKRLVSRAPSAQALFEREYRVLRSLKHPRIIDVYDYGVDGAGAYFTMELLEGSDLHALAPVPYAQACAYLRDVASSLALLHARKLLHRDISPRNVRVTADGRCKLIDFGALMSFGMASQVVGTAPCTSPEALCSAPLDQRADIYALGATAYWLLTRRFPYAATSFDQLHEAWRHPAVRPSLLVASIPQALEDLVLAMLQHDPLARPQSVDEIIDRLTTIGELPAESELQTAESYLLGTALVGRAAEMQAAQRALRALRRGAGSALLWTGAAGLGRTRLLAEACVQAQLAGATVLQVDAERDRREYGVAIALAGKLLDAAPAEAREAAQAHAPVLSRLSPALQQRLPPAQLVDIPLAPGEWRGRVQAAFRDWLLAVARTRTIVLAVDNLQRADDASVALLCALSSEGAASRLCVLGTLSSDEHADAADGVRFLRELADVIALAPLTREQTVALARTTFGELPNIVRLGEWMYRLTGGVPSHCLELASDLIKRGLVRYQGGTWFLPSEVALESLPSGLEEALTGRIGRLSNEAYALAEILSVHRGPVGLPLCRALAEARGVPDVFALLDELLHEDVLSVSGDDYRFRQEALRAILLARIEAERKRVLHAALGRALLAVSDTGDRIALVEAGFHLLRGGEEIEGAELLARTAMEFEIGTGSLQAAIPALEAARRVYLEHGRSLYELLPIVTRLATEGYYSDRRLSVTYAGEAFQMLREATGLATADRLRPLLGKRLAVYAGLASAMARFRAAPRAPVVDDFAYVFVLLVNCVTTQAGVGCVCLDTDAVRRSVDFIEPLTALGQRHITAAIHEYCVRLMQMSLECQSELREGWLSLLERLSDGTQFKSLPEYVRQLYRGGALFALGIVETWHDGDEALERARALEALELRIYDRAASQIRMLYHAGRGEMELAQMFRRRMELHAVQTGSAWQVEVTVPLTSAVSYALVGDIARLKHEVDQVERLAADIPSLRRVAKTARASYLLLRGSADEARALYEEVLAASPPRSFVGWARGMGGLAEAYNTLGRHEEALAVCERALEHMTADDRWFVRMFLAVDVQYALAEAGLGRHEAAATRLDGLIAEHEPRRGPVTLGQLHVARARVALLSGDRAQFERHLHEVERWYRPTQAPSLIARCEQLAKQGAAAFPDWAEQLPRSPVAGADPATASASAARTALRACRDQRERAHCSLRLILEHVGAHHGYLFTKQPGAGPELAASDALEPPPSALTESIRCLMEDAETEVVTRSSDDDGQDGDARTRSTSTAFGRTSIAPEMRTHLLWSTAEGTRSLVGAAAIIGAAAPVAAEFLDVVACALSTPPPGAQSDP